MGINLSLDGKKLEAKWDEDNSTESCNQCGTSFGVWNRKVFTFYYFAKMYFFTFLPIKASLQASDFLKPFPTLSLTNTKIEGVGRSTVLIVAQKGVNWLE